ncbi:hypothetical protein DSUL_170007 [Desulfovibrionales bacterium]
MPRITKFINFITSRGDESQQLGNKKIKLPLPRHGVASKNAVSQL